MSEQLTGEIDWQWKPYHELSMEEAVAIFKLRQDVFIVEQDCPFHDIDGEDDEAIHLMGWHNGKLVATLRWFPAYSKYGNRCAIGRICTDPSVRRFGVGRELMKVALQRVDTEFPDKEIKIGAQLYLKVFYERFGFKQSSDVYDEDGIDHIHMIRPASNVASA
ncbi:GNAT family N-acetyltransferase [Pleionea sediminis]|uniref:GNAT family N-acetyltransferase n=1 Tax=Pleionea sediminis TaxID=2569479 RepID=UPI0011852139|nr:GNAT family N-acetyltransferase [Pleionea sediminis]